MFKIDPLMNERLEWLYENWKGPIPIEQLVNPYTDLQLWYYIPGYNGYEISDYGIVRSLKNFNKYTFGTICRHRSNVYELSNNLNQRVKISRENLWQLALSYQQQSVYQGYPRGTCYIDRGSRNQRKFIDFGKVSKNKNVVKQPVPIRKEETSFPKFSVIPDNIKKPIYFEGENRPW